MDNKEIKVLGTGEPEPLADMLRCVKCGLIACRELFKPDQDSGWETGCYTVYTCPHCGPYAEVEYEFSQEQADRYDIWCEEQIQWEDAKHRRRQQT